MQCFPNSLRMSQDSFFKKKMDSPMALDPQANTHENSEIQVTRKSWLVNVKICVMKKQRGTQCFYNSLWSSLYSF